MKRSKEKAPAVNKISGIGNLKTTWVLDLDGVVYRGKEAIPGARDTIAKLKHMGKRVIFLTNNSTRTREMYVEVLKEMGIDTTVDDIFTSASITISWLDSHVKNQGKKPSDVNVFVVGEEGITRHLKQLGFTIIAETEFDSNPKAPENIQFVIVGLDRHLTYRKLDIALACINKGAAFLVTNDDAALPVEEGKLAPGAGSIVSALVTCSKHLPDHDSPFGKPNPIAFREISRATGEPVSRMISVGDRLETDILASKRAGVTSILVYSGITKPGDHIPEKYKPDIILNSIKDLESLF